MRKRVRLAAKTYKLKYQPHSSNLSRTCDAGASLEVHTLHAHGKLQLRKVTCEKEDSATRKEKGRRGKAEGEE